MWGAIVFLILSGIVLGNYPSFEPFHRMRILLLPSDMREGSVIYRLRAIDQDFDYPLRFDVVDAVGRSIIRIDNLPCTPTHTYCEGNVFLKRKLEPDRVYDMLLSVRDSTGQETKVDATIKGTRATSHFEDVFPYVPSLLMVPEDTQLGATLGFVLARRGTRRRTELEMWGSENFRLYQTVGSRDVANASIKLTAELDFEERTMYKLTIFALDPWTVEREDTRNIAGFTLPVVVTDVQDMPPVFTQIPPVTVLNGDLQVGDKVVQVQAQDGDRGAARQVTYGLISEKNPFITFFNISEKSGEITLAKPLKELQTITRAHQPIILTIMAEEVKMDINEPPALTATATLALLLENTVSNAPPKFRNQEYVARLKENAPQGTALVFGASYSTVVEDLDTGQDGVFSLTLLRDNGTFEISPTVAESNANFVIRVRNNELLDFEKRTSLSFLIVAKELSTGPGGLNSTASVTLYLEDENDNVPVFRQTRYEALLTENVTANALVTQVSATDGDTGLFGRILYTAILGYLNHSLTMDTNTGIITIASDNHGFDRESASEYRFMVEARDMDGVGNKATVPLIIRILDVNDETPEFERQVFEFILQPGLRNFTSRAFVKATDKDAEPPNNVVRYEILNGNPDNKFNLNEETGELTIRGRLGRKRDSLNLKQPQKKTPKELTGDRNTPDNVEWLGEGGSEGRGLALKKKNSGGGKGTSTVQKQVDYDYDDSEFSERKNDDVMIDSVIELNIRAYDLGIPHRWQRAYVRIYPPESRARNMNFIVSGASPDRRATEELLRTLTGGRVIIQDVKPYTGRESGTDLTGHDTRQEKSVVTATVFYEGNSVVDLQQLESRLTGNKTQALVNQTVQEYRSENRVLFWLLVFLLILITIAAVLLLLCCLWQGCIVCPCLEVRRKSVIVSPEDNVKFILREKSQMTETKGVQAAYSNGYGAHREAWSAQAGSRCVHCNHPSRPDGGRRPSVDSAGFIPVVAAGHRSRQPTILVEDVEAQRWEDDHHRYQKVRHGGRDHVTSFNPDVSYHRRSPNTPRFNRPNSGARPSTLVEGGSPYKSRPPEQPRRRSPRHREGAGDDYYQERLREEDHYQKRSNQGERRRSRSPDERRVDGRLSRSEDRREIVREAANDGDGDDISVYGGDIIYKQDSQVRNNSNAVENTRGNMEELQAQEGLSPRGDMQQPDSDSIRRHEVERGSVARDWEGGDEEILDRDQLYIRDGNAEILRLLTRGPKEDRPHTLVQDSGKEILMQRFMEDQSGEAAAGLLHEYLTQDYLGRLLYQQDTQSLPGHVENATQTDCDAATQTDEPAMLRPPRRNARSDNELSDEDSPRRPGWRRGKRANIKTPIMEEGESLVGSETPQVDTRPAMFALPSSGVPSTTNIPMYTENKSSILRRRKLKEKDDESSGEEEAPPPIQQPVERISRARKKQPATVQIRADSLNRLYRALKGLQQAGSLSELTHSEDEPDKNLLKKAGVYRRLTDLSETTTGSSNTRDGDDKAMPGQRSKYMDWYKNLPTNKQRKTVAVAASRRKEDDMDSGIALSSLLGAKKSKIEKKSVFTIAYDDVQTKNIRPDTNSSQKL